MVLHKSQQNEAEQKKNNLLQQNYREIAHRNYEI